MAKLIHSMFRVLDLERSVDFYREVLGLRDVRRLDFPSFTLVYLGDAESGFEVELTCNKGRAEPYAAGEGYGHLAACVPMARPSANSFSSAIPTATGSRCCNKTTSIADAHQSVGTTQWTWHSVCGPTKNA